MTKRSILVSLLVLFFATVNTVLAQASPKAVSPVFDLVLCEGLDGDVRIEILFESYPDENEQEGSFQALAMRVSDPNVSSRRSEVALFELADGLLSTTGSTMDAAVVGYIDPLNPKTGRGGERIGGTVLRALRSIQVVLDLEFSESQNEELRYAGQVIYLKKSGAELTQDLDCVRQR
ncbi:MAG: hypothetical protein RBT63_09030 [Bdellovibrionales bacterium]|jgi:hypothetical protein|nr:hypothetical protein [Bdellovibrionales bacterium]